MFLCYTFQSLAGLICSFLTNLYLCKSVPRFCCGIPRPSGHEHSRIHKAPFSRLYSTFGIILVFRKNVLVHLYFSAKNRSI